MFYDIIFIGSGFRTTTFLASKYHLLKRRIAVIEESDVFGPGAFRYLNTFSNSQGCKLFSMIDRQGEFGWIYSDPLINELTNTTGPVSLLTFGEALAKIGDFIRQKLPVDSVRLGRRALSVDVQTEAKFPVQVTLDNGSTLVGKVCVFGTGRAEKMYRGCKPLAGSSWLSSEVISTDLREKLRTQLEKISGGNIMILGCSHSAFSALERLVEVFDEIREHNNTFLPPTIRVVQRRAIRLHYWSVEEALREWVPGREERFDPSRHVSPKTGRVFSDTGLFYSSKELYCAIWRGEYPFVQMHRVTSLEDCTSLIEAADMVVHALGYTARTPEIRVNGTCVRSSDSTQRLGTGLDGFIPLNDSKITSPIAEIRVDPTPPEQKDVGMYGAGVYDRLSDRILELLAEPEEPKKNNFPI